jgi:hypothetical protein
MNPSLRRKIQQTINSNMDINPDTFKKLSTLVIQEKMDNLNIGVPMMIIEEELEKYIRNKKNINTDTKQLMDQYQNHLSEMITNIIVNSVSTHK